MPCPPLCQASSLQVAGLGCNTGHQKVTAGPFLGVWVGGASVGRGAAPISHPGDHRPSSFLTGDPAWTAGVPPVCLEGRLGLGQQAEEDAQC